MKQEDAVERSIARINEVIPAERVSVNEPMSRHTSFRIGGPAALFVQVTDEEELAQVLRVLTFEGAEHMLVGNGSNLLVSDDGYPGVAVKMCGDFERIELMDRGECCIRAGAAALMSSVASFATSHGLSGFEFASGIPGSMGGAVFMNAGAYGGEIKDIAESVRIMKADGSEVKELSNEEMGFSYRNSNVQKSNDIILSCVLKLQSDETSNIEARVLELQAKRNEKQPVNYPSAGSTFKRPKDGYAAALIEQSGLKGFKVGGAEVSEKHSGFVINTGGATCEDVLSVMRHVVEKVKEDSGICLEPEVRLINCKL